MSGTIYICSHCGNRRMGAANANYVYCGKCKTAEGRKKLDEENKAIRQERELLKKS